MVNFVLIFVVFLIVGALVYSQVQRAAAKAEALEQKPDNDKYLKFCDAIDGEITKLRTLELRDESTRDAYLDELASLSKELVFIQTMHKTNLSHEVWETKLFEFLRKSEDVILKYAKDGERNADVLRGKLGAKFSTLG